MSGIIQTRKNDIPLRIRGILNAVLLLMPAASELMGASQEFQEYQVKAAYLFNFAKFVEWPKKAFADENTPITIGILGDDPFGPALDSLAASQEIQGREIVVRRFSRIDGIENGQILFISRNREKLLSDILGRLEGKCVLTVSETRTFAFDGGMINFVIIDDKVRFEINVKAAERAKLNLSSKLLRVARTVRN